MYYWIQAGFELREDVKRVASEQFDQLRQHLTASAPDPHEAVHEARRTLRRLRALLALFRAALGPEYENLRAPYRGCTRALSALRDAQAVLEALHRVLRKDPTLLGQELADEIGQRLVHRRDRLLASAAPDYGAIRRVLRRAERQLPQWTSRASLEVLRQGLKRRYADARRALRHAQQRRGMDATHTLRRRSRELGLQYALLQSVFPSLPESGIRRAHDVAQLLGRERELLLLRRVLGRMRHAPSRRRAVAQFKSRLDEAGPGFTLGPVGWRRRSTGIGPGSSGRTSRRWPCRPRRRLPPRGREPSGRGRVFAIAA
jgi:CHAD domain-containing protein